MEDLESELLAAFAAIDVPAAFCALQIFVHAAMVAFDSWVSMLRCSVFRKSESNGELGVFISDGEWLVLETFSGPFWGVSWYDGQFWIVPFRLSLWPDGLDVWRDLRSRGDGWMRLWRQLLQYGLMCLRPR